MRACIFMGIFILLGRIEVTFCKTPSLSSTSKHTALEAETKARWSIFFSLEPLCAEECRENEKPYGRLQGALCLCHCPTNSTALGLCDTGISRACAKYCRQRGFRTGGHCVNSNVDGCHCYCSPKHFYVPSNVYRSTTTTSTPDTINADTAYFDLIQDPIPGDTENSTTEANIAISVDTAYVDLIQDPIPGDTENSTTEANIAISGDTAYFDLIQDPIPGDIENSTTEANIAISYDTA